jgi:thiamine kinase-like enzyme
LDQLRVWRTLGRYAAALNSIAESVVESDRQANDYFPMRWQEQVTKDVGLIFRDNVWVDRSEITLEQQDWLRRYLQSSADVQGIQGVCQFDLTIANALICDSDYDRIFLIDQEWANIAPVPSYQLACIAAEHGPESPITAAFFEGYGTSLQRAVEEIPDLYRHILLRAMRATAWARDRAPTLLDENIRRTRPILKRVLGSKDILG